MLVPHKVSWYCRDTSIVPKGNLDGCYFDTNDRYTGAVPELLNKKIKNLTYKSSNIVCFRFDVNLRIVQAFKKKRYHPFGACKQQYIVDPIYCEANT